MVPELPTATKILFPNSTSWRIVAVGEVALSKVVPLSVDLTIFPELTTATKVLFPNPTPLILPSVGEMALSQVVPLSVDLTMFPELPANTNTLEPEEVLVVSSVVVDAVEEPPSLLRPQEMTVRPKRNIEKMMSICFTWFPIGGLG